MRQIRKTRGRDAQSAEKLRRLRKELEDARQLVAFVRQRELARKEMFIIEKQIFQQRAEVKDMKRKLGIKDDDEDLINQKVRYRVLEFEEFISDVPKPKKKPIDVPAMQRPVPPPQLRISQRPGAQAAEDLQLLEEVQAEKENEIIREIKQNLQKHLKWNEGYVDHTTAPLAPSPKRTFEAAFRPAITTQLPTPPSSDASDANDAVALDDLHPYFRDRISTFDMDDDTTKIPSFRRRVGRGGRVMIDRRNMAARHRADIDPVILDRFKYDDDEDEDEDIVFEREKFDIQVMQHRAIMAAKAREVAQMQAHAQAQAQAQAAAQAAAQAQAQAQTARQMAGERNAPPGATMGSNPGLGAVTNAST